MSINHVNLRKMDLNLLVVFDAIMQSESVSQAAEKLCLGQPAVSHALGKLRDRFGDPILIRENGKFVATDRAKTLWEPIRKCLVDLESGLSDTATFDPSRQRKSFAMSMPDYGGLDLAHRLTQLIHNSQLVITFQIESLSVDDGFEALLDGRIELLISYGDSPDWSTSLPLYRDDHVVVYDPKQWNGPPAGLDTFCSAQHVQVSMRSGFLDYVDENLDGERSVIFSTSSYVEAASCVVNTPMLLNVPRRAANCLRDLYPVDFTQSPVPCEFEVRMYRRKASESDPASQWLIDTIRELSA